MFSFINMGSRRKRRRSKKSATLSTGSRGAPLRRTSRSSMSFLSPGDVINIEDSKPSVHPFAADADVDAEVGMDVMSDVSPIQVHYTNQRSPEIQLDLKHESLLKSLPREFLRYRNGSASGGSLEDLMGFKVPFSQASGSSSTLETSPREQKSSPAGSRRRIVPMPTVTPIQIPAVPASSIPVHHVNEKSASRNISPSHTPDASWASDNDPDPQSAVSGMSLTRDVFSKTFSFSARQTGTAEGFSSRETSVHITRQDSATLPRDLPWSNIALRSSGSSHPHRSLESKKSERSLRRLRHEAAAIALAAATIEPLPIKSRSPVPEMQEKRQLLTPVEPSSGSPTLTRKPSGPRARSREFAIASPRPPPMTTPSAQKLNRADQAALHRISLIPEADGEATSPGTPAQVVSSKRPAAANEVVPVVVDSATAASTPSNYSSKYSQSPQLDTLNMAAPHTQETEVAMAVKALNSDVENSKVDYESFLEDFRFGSPVSVSYRPQAFSPFPVTAASSGSGIGSSSGSSSVPGTATSPGYVFPSSSSPSLRRRFLAGTEDAIGKTPSETIASSSSGGNTFGVDSSHENSTSQSKSSPLSGSTVSSSNRSAENGLYSVSKRAKAMTSPKKALDSGNAVSDHGSSSGKKSVPLSVIAVKNNLPTNKELKPSTSRLPIGDGSPNSAAPNKGDTPSRDKRRPSPKPLELNSIMSRDKTSSLSLQSPDLLDMLIPDGHVVAPISRHQLTHKRSGSFPEPIKMFKLLPRDASGSNKEDSAGDAEIGTGALHRNLSYAQRFPETPDAFSPFLFSPDCPVDVSPPVSRGPSTSVRLPSSVALSRRMDSLPLQPIVIPPPPELPNAKETRSSLAQVEKSADEDAPRNYDSSKSPSRSSRRSKHSISTLRTNSPPISPLQPPPPPTPPPSYPPTPSSIVQVPSVSGPAPITFLSPVPRQRTVRSRPPLPYGPRKPLQALGSTHRPTPLPITQRKKAASETAAALGRIVDSPQSNSITATPSPLSTPTFKTENIKWRGLTLEQAKWTFTQSQLQTMVRRAIERTGHPTSIRLLPLDVLDKELPEAMAALEAKKADIQGNYKVLVRKRRILLERLSLLTSTDVKCDSYNVSRFTDELAQLTEHCDQLVEDMHNICMQIAQIEKLRDMHLASSLSMALRKLNKSLFHQTQDKHRLEMELENMQGEREEAWKKAEEIEKQLDALSVPAETEEQSNCRPLSLRASRVSIAKRNSQRASKAGLRLSGYSRSARSSSSSLHLCLSTGIRSTFSSDLIPPVPPLPSREYLTVSREFSSSHSSSGFSSLPPTSSEGLYQAVFELLGVKPRDRVDAIIPSRTQSISFPHSAPGTPEPGRNSYADSNNNNNNSINRFNGLTLQARTARGTSAMLMHSRSISLPITSDNAYRRRISAEDPETIIAMLDLPE